MTVFVECLDGGNWADARTGAKLPGPVKGQICIVTGECLGTDSLLQVGTADIHFHLAEFRPWYPAKYFRTLPATRLAQFHRPPTEEELKEISRDA